MVRRLMVANVSHLGQTENGELKQVKSNFIVPGHTFSTAEDFVYGPKLSLRGDVTLNSLKLEQIDAIKRQGDELLESWFKCEITYPDFETGSPVKYFIYINADDMKTANKMCYEHISEESIVGAEIKSIVKKNIIDIYLEAV